MSYLTVDTNRRFDIPLSVAVCPYCDAITPLYAEAESWEQQDDGSWIASGIRLECTSEPELEEGATEATEEAWQDWLNRHSYMPYVYWLPVDRKALAWINSRHRFRIED